MRHFTTSFAFPWMGKHLNVLIENKGEKVKSVCNILFCFVSANIILFFINNSQIYKEVSIYFL